VRLLIATHMYQSNYLAKQKQGALNKYNLNIFLDSSRLLRGLGRCASFQDHSRLPVDPLDMTVAPHPRFPVQCHKLSTGGDAHIIVSSG
jgi:hypothetical protein